MAVMHDRATVSPPNGVACMLHGVLLQVEIGKLVNFVLFSLLSSH